MLGQPVGAATHSMSAPALRFIGFPSNRDSCVVVTIHEPRLAHRWPNANLPLLFSSRAPPELASNPDPSAPSLSSACPAYPVEFAQAIQRGSGERRVARDEPLSALVTRNLASSISPAH